MPTDALPPVDPPPALMQSPALYLLCMAAYALLATLLVRRDGFHARLVAGLTASPGYSAGIEGLRGILALSVYFHHAIITYFFLRSGVWAVPPSRFYAHLGPSAVSLFFSITGYLFWSKLLRTPRMDWRAYFRARARRLAPAYFVAVSLVVVIAFYAGAPPALREGPFRIGRELFSWYSFGVAGGFPDIDGLRDTPRICASVFWSLRVEWFFYLALPLIAWFARGSRTLLLALGVGVASVVLASVEALGASPARLAGLVHSAGSASRMALGGFLPGIVVAYVAARHPRMGALLARPRLGIVPLVALAATLVFTDPHSAAAQLGLAVVFAFVALGCDVFGALRSRGLLLLGSASYSFYLLHGIFLYVVSRSANGVVPLADASPLLLWCGIAATGAVVVLASLLSYRYVERPFMKTR